MADKYWGPANSVWSNGGSSGNWYADASFTIHTSMPIGADDVHFIANSGDCQLDVTTAYVKTITFTDSTNGDYPSTKTFDFNGKTLDCAGDSDFSGDYTLSLPTGSKLLIQAYADRSFKSKAGAVWPTIELNNPGSSKYTVTCSNAFTVNNLRFVTATASGTIVYYANSAGQIIRGYTISGSGVAETDATFSTFPTWATNVTLSDFNKFSTYAKFGYDTSITVTNDSHMTQRSSWYFANDSTNNITIQLKGPAIYASYLEFKTTNSGDLTIDWTGANYVHALPAYYAGTYDTARTDLSSKLILKFGSNNNFGTTGTMNLAYATELQGSSGNTFFWDRSGAGGTFYYKGPVRHSANDVITNQIQLPGQIKVHATVSSTFDLYGGIDIADDVDISGTIRSVNIHSTADTEHPIAIFRGDVSYNVSPTYGCTITYDRPVEHYGTVLFKYSGSYYTTTAFNPGDSTHIFHDDVTFDTKSELVANVDTTWQFHLKRNDNRTLSLKSDMSSLDTFFHVVLEAILNDSSNGSGTYDFKLDKAKDDILKLAGLNLYNRIAKPMHVLITAVDEDKAYELRSFASEGYGDPCTKPIATNNNIICRSDTTGSPWRFKLTNPSYASFTSFQDSANISSIGMYADDGTCVDYGGNTGIEFSWDGPSLAICPSTTASFSAYWKGGLPAAKSYTLKNILTGDLVEPTAYGFADWLHVEFADNGDGTWNMTVQPTTTESAGTHTDTFYVASAGARRSPQLFTVNYTVSTAIIPVPDTDLVELYQLRDETYPADVTVGVDNASPGSGELQPITVTAPAWLDVTVLPVSSSSSSSSSGSSSSPAPGDHQEFILSLNATGRALPSGVYTDVIVIDAPNATEASTLPVEMVVERILLFPNQSELTFSMIYAGSLPAEQTFNVGNSGEGGTIKGLTVTSTANWVTATRIGDGNGNNQNILVEINSHAQSLAAGLYTADLTLTANNADNDPCTVQIRLNVAKPRPFELQPNSVTFEPGRDWTLPPAQQVHVVSTGQGPFAAPVTVTDVPDWLQVTIDAMIPTHQIITLTPINLPTKLEDFQATLHVTGSYTADLAVSMTVPAFFKRADCTMDFIPKIDGTIIDECDVPPPPPPAPREPPIAAPQPAPTHPSNITITGPPCIECKAWVVFENQAEYGYGKPHYYIDCKDHGCGHYRLLSAGTYGGGKPDGSGFDLEMHVTSITIDACGHICNLRFDDDDVSC